MKNVNNWKLVAVFGILVLAFAGIRFFGSSRHTSNLPDQLTEIDSAKVTEIVISPAAYPGQEVRLIRVGNWKLNRDGKDWRLEQGGGTNVLNMLMRLNPKKLATRKKEKWNEFNAG